MAVTSDTSNAQIFAAAKRAFPRAFRLMLSSCCAGEQPNAVEWCISATMEKRAVNQKWQIVARAYGRQELLLVLQSMKPMPVRLGVFNG